MLNSVFRTAFYRTSVVDDPLSESLFPDLRACPHFDGSPRHGFDLQLGLSAGFVVADANRGEHKSMLLRRELTSTMPTGALEWTSDVGYESMSKLV